MHAIRSPTATSWVATHQTLGPVRKDLPDPDDYRFSGQGEGDRLRLPSVAAT